MYAVVHGSCRILFRTCYEQSHNVKSARRPRTDGAGTRDEQFLAPGSPYNRWL